MPDLDDGVDARFCRQMTMDPNLLMKHALYQFRHSIAQKAQRHLTRPARLPTETPSCYTNFLYWLYPDKPHPCLIGG